MRAGQKHTAESRAKMSARQVGEKNVNWTGDTPSYTAVHQWLRKHKVRTRTCQECGTQNVQTEFANIDGQYRRNVDDYIELCLPCHRVADCYPETQILTRRTA